jgi:nucleotide-binding universal stress UspA family protein
MHVLVATEGQLDATTVAKFVGPLTRDGGHVTVLTVIEVPRAMLQDLRSHFNDTPPPRLLHGDMEGMISTDPIEPPRSWPGDDAMIEQYLTRKKDEICRPLEKEMRAAGIDVTSEVAEGRPAQGILAAASSLEADLIVIGSHGAGLFEGLLGSTGTKVTRLARRPVLLLRTNRAD